MRVALALLQAMPEFVAVYVPNSHQGVGFSVACLVVPVRGGNVARNSAAVTQTLQAML
jgi:hypothetical protein